MVRLREFSILIFHKLLKKATSRKKRSPGNLRLLICYLFMSTTSLTTLVYFWFIQYHQTYHCGFYSVRGKYTYRRK